MNPEGTNDPVGSLVRRRTHPMNPPAPFPVSSRPQAISPALYDPLLSAVECFDSASAAALDYSVAGPQHEEEEAPFQHQHQPQHVPNHRLGKELGSAAAAALLVSPLVSIIDRCIVKETSSGVDSFVRSMGRATGSMLRDPRAFLAGRSFRLTFLVYFGTFAVANCSDLALDWQRPAAGASPSTATTAGASTTTTPTPPPPQQQVNHDDPMRRHAKVAASAIAHIGLMGWRDAVFAREFSRTAGARPLPPLRTLGLFALRDASKIYATFAAVPIAAAYLHRNLGVDPHAAELSMALALPALSQVVSAPLHIHAMDVYLRPAATTVDYYRRPAIGVADRWATVRAEFSAVALARGLRILPALGIGSYSNNRFREAWGT